MKQIVLWLTALCAVLFASLGTTACSEDATDEEYPTAPLVSLASVAATKTSLTFSVASEHAREVAWLCVEKSKANENGGLTADRIRTWGDRVYGDTPITLEDLKPQTDYAIAAVAWKGGLYSTVARIDMTTGALTPALAIRKGTAGETTLTFTADFTNVQTAAYVVIEKTTGATVPSAAEVLKSGVVIEEEGEVTVSNLDPATNYIIAAAAANRGLYTAVQHIEMTTATPAPTLELKGGAATESTLSFSATAEYATAIYYMHVKKGETLPQAAQIVTSGTRLPASGQATISRLQAETTYVIVAVATNAEKRSEVASLEMTTAESTYDASVLDRQVGAGEYTEKVSGSYCSYYFVLSNADEGTTPRRELHLDLSYFKSYSTPVKLTTGDYTISDKYGLRYAYGPRTFCIDTESNGQKTQIDFKSGKIKVATSANGYKITTDLVTEEGETFTVTYDGPVSFEQEEPEPEHLPLIGANCTGLNLTHAYAAYYDYGAYDNAIIHLYDVEPGGLSYGSDYLTTDGNMLCLDLTVKVSPAGEIVLEEGTYGIAEQSAIGSALVGEEFWFEYVSAYVPSGTYLEHRLSYSSSYGFLTGGSVKVTKSGTGYRFECDFTDANGYRISGTYEGEVTWRDKRKGSSSAAPRRVQAAEQRAGVLKLRR